MRPRLTEKLSAHPMTLHAEGAKLTNQSIVIVGPSRTGSRLLGSLLHSLDNVEYLFEPLMLYALIPKIHEMSKETWKLLYETYLVEEFLLNAMAGRFLNLNEHDYSCVLVSKGNDEIKKRMSKSYSRKAVLASAPKKQLVLKLSDLTPFVSQMKKYYPQMQSIVMLRNPDNTIGSLVRKETYSDEMLAGPSSYPPYKELRGCYIPAWIPDVDLKKFLDMSMVERCAYSYSIAYHGVLSDQNLIVIDYDEFKYHPHKTFTSLCSRLGGSFGKKTEEVLKMVKEPKKNRIFSWSGVDSKIRSEVYNVYDQLAKRITI